MFRPSSGQWFVLGGSPEATGYGTTGDIPVPGDYDGDGKTDIAVFRPSSGTWFVHNSTGTDTAVTYGSSDEVPLPLPSAIRGSFFSTAR